VYFDGSANGFPDIRLAKADTFNTSKVIGIATHDIPASTYGYITTYGQLGGDFSAFSNGDLLYVSDTVAGGLVNYGPNIATRVGEVLSTGTGGKMLVNIENHLSLPTVLAFMHQGTVPATITGTFQDINNYGIHGAMLMTYDAALGDITVPTSGFYRCTVNLSLRHDSVGNTRPVLTMRTWRTDNTGANYDVSTSLARNAESCSFFPSFIFEAVAGKTYRIQIMADNDITGVTVDMMSFDVKSLHIRS
jgi:hypothetical protein